MRADLAKQTPERTRKGPSEDEIKPPVGLADKVLVVLWIAILIPAVTFIVNACLEIDKEPLRATEALLDAAAAEAARQ